MCHLSKYTTYVKFLQESVKPERLVTRALTRIPERTKETIVNSATRKKKLELHVNLEDTKESNRVMYRLR